jgi:chemotaxis protein methyltransferase CheR
MTLAPAARVERRTALVEGEFLFTAEDFRQIAAIMYDQAGISLADSKATLVYSRLAKRLRILGMDSFSAYCALVLQDREEAQNMLRALTTNVTRFFREPHHFDDLRETVLLPMADEIRRGGRLRLWSAACSTGQEPYSMALTVLSVFPDAANLDIKILATDIDSNVVATGKAAVYDESQIEPVPGPVRNQFFERDPSSKGMWRVGAAARSMVSFKELNLIGDWPMKGPFHAVFCRNVVIYFDEPTQERIWTRFAPLIADGGRLYIGHSERVPASNTSFESNGLTSYRKVGGR